MIFAHCTFQNRKVFQDKDKGIIISGNSLALQVKGSRNKCDNLWWKWFRKFNEKMEEIIFAPLPILSGETRAKACIWM